MTPPLLVGIALALLASVALNAGYLVQHLGSQHTPDISIGRPIATLRGLLASRLWLLGSIAGVLGMGAARRCALPGPALARAGLLRRWPGAGRAARRVGHAHAAGTSRARRDRRHRGRTGAARVRRGRRRSGRRPSRAAGRIPRRLPRRVGRSLRAARRVAPPAPARHRGRGALWQRRRRHQGRHDRAHAGGLAHGLLSPWPLAIALACAGGFFCLQRRPPARGGAPRHRADDGGHERRRDPRRPAGLQRAAGGDGVHERAARGRAAPGRRGGVAAVLHAGAAARRGRFHARPDRRRRRQAGRSGPPRAGGGRDADRRVASAARTRCGARPPRATTRSCST